MAAAASAAGDSSGSAIRSVRPRSVRTRAADATRTLSCEGQALMLGCIRLTNLWGKMLVNEPTLQTTCGPAYITV